jgi:hypothetical protein
VGVLSAAGYRLMSYEIAKIKIKKERGSHRDASPRYFYIIKIFKPGRLPEEDPKTLSVTKSVTILT